MGCTRVATTRRRSCAACTRDRGSRSDPPSRSRFARWSTPVTIRSAMADATDVRKTTCYMCACRCGIRVHLRDGQVRYIDGNPDHPINRGVICAKGASGIMKQYSPARLTKPLKRKPGSERGAGELVEISWDEALSTLETRLAR